MLLNRNNWITKGSYYITLMNWTKYFRWKNTRKYTCIDLPLIQRLVTRHQQSVLWNLTWLAMNKFIDWLLDLLLSIITIHLWINKIYFIKKTKISGFEKICYSKCKLLFQNPDCILQSYQKQTYQEITMVSLISARATTYIWQGNHVWCMYAVWARAWWNLQKHTSHSMRKPVYAICEQQRRRWYNISSFCIQNFKPLASLCSWAGWFESYLVANPEYRFSRDVAHMWTIRSACAAIVKM